MNPTNTYENKRLTIKQWSVQDRPREKYAKGGAAALTDAELIAILLRTGNPNDSAVELAKKYGTNDSYGFVNGILGKVIEKQHESGI